MVWSCDMALRPRDLASRMASRRTPKTGFEDGFLRETFTLPRGRARDRAREFLNRYCILTGADHGHGKNAYGNGQDNS
jgi:hypothetical protein